MRYKQFEKQNATIYRVLRYQPNKSEKPTRQSLQRLFRLAVGVLEVCCANRNALPQFFANIEHDIERCLQLAKIGPLAANTPRLAALRIFDRFYRSAGLPLNIGQYRACIRHSRLNSGGF